MASCHNALSCSPQTNAASFSTAAAVRQWMNDLQVASQHRDKLKAGTVHLETLLQELCPESRSKFRTFTDRKFISNL